MTDFVVDTDSSDSFTLGSGDTLAVNAGVTLAPPTAPITWDLGLTTVSTAASVGNHGTITSAANGFVVTGSKPVPFVNAVFLFDNYSDGIFIANNDLFALGSGLGGYITVNNSGLLRSLAGRAFNITYDGSGIYYINNNADGTIAAYDDAIRLTVADPNAADYPNGNQVLRGSNAGTIRSTIGEALDLRDVRGQIEITNTGTGALIADASDAIRTATATYISNAGRIEASAGSASDAIDFGPAGAGSISNAAGGAILGAANGIVATKWVAVTNSGAITGNAGRGVSTGYALDSAVFNRSFVNNSTGVITGTATAGADGDGVHLTAYSDGINNAGTIRSLGHASSVGGTAAPVSSALYYSGGSLTNTGSIIGDERGITVRNPSEGTASTGVSINNSGLIEGKGGAAIDVSVTNANTTLVANNAAGIIRGDINIAGPVSINNLGKIFGNISLTDAAGQSPYSISAVGLYDAMTGNITVRSGLTTNLNINAALTGNIDTGAEADNVTVFRQTGSSSIAYVSGNISLGGGDDSLTLNLAQTGGSLDGGAGIDTFRIFGSDASAPLALPAMTGFEKLEFYNGTLAYATDPGFSSIGAGGRLTLSAATVSSDLAIFNAGLGVTSGASVTLNGVVSTSSRGVLQASAAVTTLANDNSGLRGGILIDGGSLVLKTPTSGGTAPITFNTTAAESLVLAQTALATGGITNVLKNFGPNDSIDLQGIGTATVSGYNATTGTLTIDRGGPLLTLKFDTATTVTTGRTFYITSDGDGGSLLSLTDNVPPKATPASLTIAEDTPFSGSVTAVDPDTALLSFATATGPQHGSLTFASNGSYTYTPAANYYGTDSFSFTAYDGKTLSSPATVAITITAVNDAPALTGTPATLPAGSQGSPYTVTAETLLRGWSDVEGSPLSIVNLTASSGTVGQTAPGVYVVTPAAGASGVITLSYDVSDGQGGLGHAGLGFELAAANHAPTAATQVFAGSQGTVLQGQLLATDPDGQPLTYSLDVAPLYGQLVLPGDGHFTYTPGAGFHGIDLFSFKASDGSLSTGSTAVLLSIAAVNQAPTGITVVGGSVVEHSANGTLVAQLTAVDPDAGDRFSWSLLDSAGGRFALDSQTGTLTVADGTNLDYAAASQLAIGVTVTDAGGLAFTRQLTITLTQAAGGETSREARTTSLSAAADRFSGDSAYSWHVSGLGGNDVITTGDGNDVLTGGNGNDSMSAGGGNDVFLIGANAGTDAIDGGSGFDRIVATAAKAVIKLSALAGVEEISSGGFAGVTVSGGTAADRLDLSGANLVGIAAINGGGGNDSIIGAGSDDVIAGGLGVDQLSGGAGNDRFSYAAVTESRAGLADHILDFASGDRIDLTLVDANAAVAGRQGFTFIGDAAFTAVGQLRLGTDHGLIALFGNTSGDARPEFEIILDNGHALSAADLLI